VTVEWPWLCSDHGRGCAIAVAGVVTMAVAAQWLWLCSGRGCDVAVQWPWLSKCNDL